MNKPVCPDLSSLGLPESISSWLGSFCTERSENYHGIALVFGEDETKRRHALYAILAEEAKGRLHALIVDTEEPFMSRKPTVCHRIAASPPQYDGIPT